MKLFIAANALLFSAVFCLNHSVSLRQPTEPTPPAAGATLQQWIDYLNAMLEYEQELMAWQDQEGASTHPSATPAELELDEIAIPLLLTPYIDFAEPLCMATRRYAMTVYPTRSRFGAFDQ